MDSALLRIGRDDPTFWTDRRIAAIYFQARSLKFGAGTGNKSQKDPRPAPAKNRLWLQPAPYRPLRAPVEIRTAGAKPSPLSTHLSDHGFQAKVFFRKINNVTVRNF